MAVAQAISGLADSDMLIGRKTKEGGEIFNDYENNKALTQFSHAEGVQTIAGTYAFNIVSWDESNKTYTLDSVEGLEVKDVFSIKWNTSHINYGEIIAINDNTITVDKIIINAEDFETKKLFIVEKPEIGTEPFDEGAHAEGYDSQAVLYSAHAEGGETKAMGRYAHAEGRATQAGYSAHSEGRGTKALGEMSHAEGGYTEALGHYSHAEGYYTKALSIGSGLGASHAEGGETIADGQRSHAEGSKTHTLGYASHAEGLTTVASGQASHAEGVSTTAGTYAFNILAWDKSNKTYTLDSVEGLAVGDIFSVKWNTSHINYGKITAIEDNIITVNNIVINAENFETKKLFIVKKPEIGTEPFDKGAHAEGYKTKAIGDFAHSEGNNTTSSGQAAHAEGVQTEATVYAAHAEGNITKACNTAAHAEGSSTIADGIGSHSEGIRTRAVGAGSHAEGFVDDGCQDDYGATGKASHVEGHNTKAEGEGSHAEGHNTIASGNYSHAGGLGTKTNAEAQTSIGKYNAEDKDALFIIGNGTSNTDRKNAFVVKNDENGNGYATINESPIIHFIGTVQKLPTNVASGTMCLCNGKKIYYDYPIIHDDDDGNAETYSVDVELPQLISFKVYAHSDDHGTHPSILSLYSSYPEGSIELDIQQNSEYFLEYTIQKNIVTLKGIKILNKGTDNETTEAINESYDNGESKFNMHGMHFLSLYEGTYYSCGLSKFIIYNGELEDDITGVYIYNGNEWLNLSIFSN